MSLLLICTVAFLASGLTFFSGFGLGTLLLPAFALFYPIEQAVALTAVVHFLNNMFKLGLVSRHADRHVVLLFGLPAVAAAFAGAWVLLRLSQTGPAASYSFAGHEFFIMPVKLAVGLLLMAFSLAELLPRFRSMSFDPKYLPLGGVLSGFFGGLSGMQGALRSAFLAKCGLTKEAFIATGVVAACLIDATRLGMYGRMLASESGRLDYGVLAAAVVAAFVGAWLGNRYLKKMTMQAIQTLIAVLLFAVAVSLICGWI